MEQKNENTRNVDGGLGKVLPGTIFIFYLPQNNGPDILKGNDHRLINCFTMCLCFPHPHALYLLLFTGSLVSICCSFQNKSFVVLKKVNTHQSNPFLAKLFLACKMKEVESRGPSFISGFQQGLAPRGKTS